MLQHSRVDKPETLACIHGGSVDGHQILRTRVELIKRKVGIGPQLGAAIRSVLGQIDVIQGGWDAHTSTRHRDKEAAAEVSGSHGHVIVGGVGVVAVGAGADHYRCIAGGHNLTLSTRILSRKDNRS